LLVDTSGKDLTALPSDYAMALVIPIRRVWPWIIALYKFLCRHLKPTLDPNVFASLFGRFDFVLKFVRSKWQTWYGKQRYSKPPPSNPGTSDRVESNDQDLKEADVDEKTVVPLDNISCSLYPYATGLHDSARSSRILNASRSSHNLGIISQSRNASRSSQNAGSSTRSRSPLGGGYTFTIQPTSPRRTYSMSSPELGRPKWHPADLHDAVIQGRHHVSEIFPQPRSTSPVGSIELLSPGEISSLHDRRQPVSSIQQPTELPQFGTSFQIHTDDLEIPALNHHRIYPVVPEFFQRYEKRRRM
jgi:hypothetical protein